MTVSEHLSRAPIVEALLDVRVTLPGDADLDALAGVQSRLGDRFPTKQIRKTWTGQVEFRPDSAPVAKTDEGPSGFQFTSADGKEVVLARPDGFSYSRLQPYTDWDAFSAAAKAGWQQYQSLMKPKSVTRIALRYINRILLPASLGDMGEYLQTGPVFAQGLPQRPRAFFFRAVLYDEQSKSTVIVTEAIEEAKHDAPLPLILDIDVFRLGNFPTASDKLWALFPALHETKNRFFFSSITEATKDLYR